MNKILLACALAIASLTSAQAQNAVNPLRFVAGFGVTYGGDNLATATYTNGSSANIKAGSGLQLLAGLDYRINPQFSVQGTVGYHAHFTPAAENGDARFERFPIELIGYFHANEQWRVGGGVRFLNSPKLVGNGAASDINSEFKNSTGAILEAEYFSSPKLGIKMRLVSEKVETKLSSTKYDANHIGLLLSYYF